LIVKAQWLARVRELLARLSRLSAAANARLARLDPNEDPDAEPLTWPPLLALSVALTLSLEMWFRWKVQPLVDLYFHLGTSAVVADRGRAGSIYTALYRPYDPLLANSLLSTIAGWLGKVIGVTPAFRGCMIAYHAGVPLAFLYALRVFGRSAWPAVLATALVYGRVYQAGFANMLFAAPLLVLVVPLVYRALDRISASRIRALLLLFCLLFVGHAMLFLWGGVLGAFVTLWMMGSALAQRGVALRARILRAAARAMIAVYAVAPSLALFVRWYLHGQADAQIAAPGSHPKMEAFYTPLAEKMDLAFGTSLKPLESTQDITFLVMFFAVALLAVSLARRESLRGPPLLELACAVTAISYFILPQDITGTNSIATRQLPIALWTAGVFAVPLRAGVSRFGRYVVILGILGSTFYFLRAWRENLVAFEETEARGLETVIDAMAPRKRLAYVKPDPGSRYFPGRALWHVENLYMGEKLGEGCDPSPYAFGTTTAAQHRFGINPAPYEISANWPFSNSIWTGYDYVLVRRWHPSGPQLAEAQKRGHLLAASGDWEVWDTHP
jgi:hypothetical protein